jgi:hypothetical protein
MQEKSSGYEHEHDSGEERETDEKEQKKLDKENCVSHAFFRPLIEEGCE